MPDQKIKVYPNKGQKMAPSKGKGNLRPVQEKRDDDIMHTNDSSIVSKRSVSKQYFPNEPDFYEPVTQKFVRRNPLINRGYWLRMHAIEQEVLRFLDEKKNVPKVIVNLGCGYDPLPFQFWHRHDSSCGNATFVDVDYPQLIERKRDRLLASALLRDSLLETNLRSSTPPVFLRSDKYAAIGCDLKDLDTLERVLSTEFAASSSSILFVAEVSVTYMPSPDADALIKWASAFDDARFCLLEQYLPQGASHPFAETMLRHFNKLQTTIHAVKEYPTLSLQQSRFTKAGWSVSTACNLWELWSDDVFTPSSLRRGLDAVEPFDEWEEFALFAGHYFLLVASTTTSPKQLVEKGADSDSQVETPHHSPRESLMLEAQVSSSGPPLTPRRFGAAYILGNNILAVHGGQGQQHRLASTDVLSRSNSDVVLLPLPTKQARICHTITGINDKCALLVGGRTSPSQSLPDCWYLEDGTWEKVEELRPARFRHSAVRVTVPWLGSEVAGVLVFGGKTSEGLVLDECNIWTRSQGWQLVSAKASDGESRPRARFGAAISSVGAGHGFIVGGMTSDGTVLDDFWEYNVSAAPPFMHVQFRDRTLDIYPVLSTPLHARFGASLVPFGDSLLLVGGISNKNILGLSEEFVTISAGEDKIHIDTPAISFSTNTWPLLVGCAVATVSEDEVVIAAGGAVCFSMGSFWNNGYITITKAGSFHPSPWSVSTIQAPALTATPAKLLPNNSGSGKRKVKGKRNVTPKLRTIPRITLQSSEEFSELVKASKPAIIEGLDLGPCTSLWTLDYLKAKLGPDRQIVVHECSSDRMTFKDKNFQYVKKSVQDFLDGISQGSQTYLRAISETQPNKLTTKLEDDFPTIAPDFCLPDVLSPVKETYHSSPLRIAGPVSLWLHYDVLANVLCQIKGTKTLQLYPPSDVKFLDYPPGGSSSNINVQTSRDPKLQYTHPHIALLKPGDVLFIPPMWSHTATPEDGYSMAVNVFFRNLEKGYAAGRDVYGNRDLQAYETGRRDVEKIVKAFRDVPAEMRNFYLERLAGELMEKAEGVGRK